MRVGVILEGPGDRQAVPILIAKAGLALGMQIFAHDPIECGGAHKLVRDGQLERFVKLAASKPDIDAVLIVVDLDDGCAAQMHEHFSARIAAMGGEVAKDVRVCFCVREYESWFLEDLDNLKVAAPEYDWIQDYECANPVGVRGAKGFLNRGMRRHYKETTDQGTLTRRLDLQNLFRVSRSFRKFVRALTGYDYELLATAFE